MSEQRSGMTEDQRVALLRMLDPTIYCDYGGGGPHVGCGRPALWWVVGNGSRVACSEHVGAVLDETEGRDDRRYIVSSVVYEWGKHD